MHKLGAARVVLARLGRDVEAELIPSTWSAPTIDAGGLINAGAASIGAWHEGGVLLFLFSLSNVLQHIAIGR